MSHKIQSFALALILLFAAIIVEANSSCPYSKRSNNPLAKRNSTESQTCPCALAQATFTKNVIGITVYSQSECGTTTITGYLTGLVDPKKNNYTFFILDRCGNVIHNLTNTLNAKINDDGTTQFTAKANDINLNCDKDGILDIFCKTPQKSNYTYYKRDGTGSSMSVNNGNGQYALADINSL